MPSLKVHFIEEKTGRKVAVDRIAQAPHVGDEVVNGDEVWKVNRVVWVLDERTSAVLDRVNVGVVRVQKRSRLLGWSDLL